MKDKCTKYEALFTFSNEEQLNAHIKECDECQKEDEIMKKVSSLIQEVKPYYKNRQNVATRLKAACILFAILLGGATFSLISFNTDISDTLKYGTTLSSEDLGLPVDSYGLIMVD